MKGQSNSRVVGATVIGFALVFGAYVLSNFGEPRYAPQTAAVQTTESTARVAIEVVDEDNNGIEDWRDDFVITEPVVVDKQASDYTPPDTLTGQMSISFMEGIIRSRGYGPFGSTEEEVIASTVDILSKETDVSLYDTPDVIIMEDWDEDAIVQYANTAARVLYNNSVPDLESELFILHDVLSNKAENRVSELVTLASVYKNYRDGMLQIPVPAILTKEHLDLINAYHALYNDIDAMTLAQSDPAVTLLRLKRYEEDVEGMAYALDNLYTAIQPFAGLFTTEDPALLFAAFSTSYQIQ